MPGGIGFHALIVQQRSGWMGWSGEVTSGRFGSNPTGCFRILLLRTVEQKRHTYWHTYWISLSHKDSDQISLISTCGPRFLRIPCQSSCHTKDIEEICCFKWGIRMNDSMVSDLRPPSQTLPGSGRFTASVPLRCSYKVIARNDCSYCRILSKSCASLHRVLWTHHEVQMFRGHYYILTHSLVTYNVFQKSSFSEHTSSHHWSIFVPVGIAWSKITWSIQRFASA